MRVHRRGIQYLARVQQIVRVCGFFQQPPLSLVAEEFEGQIYLLLYVSPGKSMTQSSTPSN